MKRTVLEAVVAVVLATMGASLQASTDIVELHNISFALTDLDLGDGIAPDFFPAFPGAVESTFHDILDGYSPGGPGLVTEGFLTAPPVNSPLGTMPGAGDSGSMSPGRVVVEADATGSGTAELDGFSGGGYFVSPHTRVTLTADAVFQSIGGGWETVNLCLYVSCSNYTSFFDGTRTRSFSVTISNDADQYTGTFASVLVQAFASGVPELPTSVMLLASSALFAWRPMRRRLQRPSTTAGPTGHAAVDRHHDV